MPCRSTTNTNDSNESRKTQGFSKVSQGFVEEETIVKLFESLTPLDERNEMDEVDGLHGMHGLFRAITSVRAA